MRLQKLHSMTRILFLLALLIIVSSCSKNENEMILTGSIKGLKKGTIILERIGDTSLIRLDSVVIDGDPTFTIVEEIAEPEMLYLYLRLKNGELLDERIPFFAESSEINITTTLENFGNVYEISGSINQDQAKDYNKVMNRYIDKNLELIKNELTAAKNGDDSLVIAYQKQRQNHISSKYLAAINFAKNHPDSELAPYIMITDAKEVNVKYLDTVYNALSPKIKDSKYGKDLESLIAKRKE